MAQEQSFENLNLQGANLEQDNLDINANNLSYPNSKNGTADLNLYRRQDVVTGTPPFSQKQTGQPGGYDEQFFNMLGEAATKNVIAKQDTKKYSKPMLYDSTAGSSHKARYLAYGQETYDKVGFNPMIDNEALFNAHTSQFDDWVRMATVAAPMYIQGFLAPMKSYVQAFTGDFGADTKEAIDFEEASAIGRTTKGGALGFLTNVQNSVAYSAGVLTQTVLENALIGAVTGTAAGPGGTAAGGIVGGATGLIRGIAKLPMALGKMTWGGAKMLTNLKNAKNFEAAKDMFVAGSKTTANFFNPIENTTNAFAKNVFSNADNLAGLARASRTAGAFYQDVNLINSALSEGRLEGGFVENETYKNFYDEHFKRFNRAPTSDEQLEYRKRAKLAGFQDTWQNALLINYSNKLAFPNLFRGNFMSQVVKKVGSGYDVILEKGAKGAVDASFKLAQVNIKNGLKSLAKPGTYGKVGLNYFKTNISEGFQEVGQDILADANKKYYTDTYYDKSKESFDYAMSSLWSAAGHQANAQGFETFASGFLMGGFLRPFNGMVPRYLAQGYQKYWKQRGVNEEGVSNYQVYKTKQAEEGQKLVDTLNKMRANGVDFLNGRAVNYGAQSIIAKRQQSGELNKREVIDSAHLSFVSDAISSIQAGTYDAWLDNFKTFKNLTPEQIEEVWELEKGEGQKALNAMDEGIKRAEQLKKAHEYAKNNIARKKINLQDLKKGSDEYEKAMLNNKALDAGLFSYVFYTSKFQDNLERVNKLYSKMSNFPALKKLTAATAQDLTDPNKLRRSLSMLKTEIDAMDEKVSPAVKEEKERKNEIYYALRNFQAAQKEWFNTFLNRQNIEKTKQELLKENPDLTDNELEEQAIDKISAEFEEKGLDPMNDYKNSFVELLKTLSEDQVDYHKFVTELTGKNKNESDIFEDLIDIHYLNVSNKNLVPIVNFLSAPEAFNEHVDKNLQWMTDLYENRNDDHKRIVNQSFETVANRDALQALADQGIYMDLDQFADYMEDQRFLPEFFIDSVNERIITQDSLLYNRYLDELNEALEVKENPPAGKPDSPQEKLDFLIKEKNQQREKELSDAELAFRQDIENEIGIPYEQILENQEGIDGDNAVTQSDAWKFYQKRIKSINDTYDKAIEALKDKYTVVQEIEPSTDAMAKAVEEVKAMLLSDDEYTATRRNYIIKGKVYERMTSRIRQNYDKYKYDELPTLEDAYDSTIGTDGLTEKSIKAFISKLRSEEPRGFEDYTYTELEEELKLLMEEPLTETAPTEDIESQIAKLETERDDLLESLARKFGKEKTEYSRKTETFEGEYSNIVTDIIIDNKTGEEIASSTSKWGENNYEKISDKLLKLGFSKKEAEDIYYNRSKVIGTYPTEKEIIDEYDAKIAALKTPASDIEAKRAEIEKRRQETLNNIKFVAADFDHYIVPSLFGDKKFTFKEQAKEAINAKYDAELAALETPVDNQAKINKLNVERKEKLKLYEIKNLSLDDKIDIINNNLGGLGYSGLINSPAIVLTFVDREPSTSFLEKPITREGDYYRIITTRHNVLVDENLDIVSTTNTKTGKTYQYKQNEIGLSTVEIKPRVPKNDRLTKEYTELFNENVTYKKNKQDEINAEYDSKIAALEGAPVTNQAKREKNKERLLAKDVYYNANYNNGRADNLANSLDILFKKLGYNALANRYNYTTRNTGSALSLENISNNWLKIILAENVDIRFLSALASELSFIESTLTEDEKSTFNIIKTIVNNYNSDILKDANNYLKTAQAIKDKKANNLYYNATIEGMDLAKETGFFPTDATEKDFNNFYKWLDDVYFKDPRRYASSQEDEIKLKQYRDKWDDAYGKYVEINNELVPLKQAPVEKVSTAKTKTLRSVQKELDALNDKIDKLNEQIDEADDAGNKVRGENLRMRRQELYDLLKETAEKGKQAVPEIKSDLKNYVLSYAIENTYENSKANGIYLDNQYKAVFDPGSEGPQFNPKIISQEAYDNLFGENGYITNIKKRADAGEFYVFSTNLIVYADNLKDPEGNPLPPVAGEIDFIFVDREGNKFIVDLKTGNVAKWINYNTFGQKSYDKKIENTLQQVGYANLSQKRSGEEFQIAIFPLEIEYDKTGFITKAGRPSNPTLMLNQKPIGDPKSESFIINLDKNVKFDMPSTEGAKVYMTAMDFMEQYVTGPVSPGKKAKSRVQTVPQDEASIVDSITREIESGNVIKAGVDANLAKTQGTISEASYKYLIGLLNEKMNTNLIESSVLAAPGQQFITINDIFAEKFDGIVSTEVKVNTGDIVTVESVDEANEEIILTTNNGEKFTVKFSEMNDYIVSPEQLDDLSAPTEPTYQPTQTEIDFAAESIVNVDEFLDSSELRNEATDEADKQSPDEIDNDLFSNLKC